MRFHPLPGLQKRRCRSHTTSYNFSLPQTPSPTRSPGRYSHGKPLQPEQERQPQSARSRSAAARGWGHAGTRGDQIRLLPPEESSCRYNTPVNHAGGRKRLLREALIGESPNKAVRSHPRTHLLAQHFQKHQRERKDWGKGLERDCLPPARPGCLGRELLPSQPGVQRMLLAPQQPQEQTGRGGQQPRTRGSGAASPAAPSACPDSHLPRRDPGPAPRGCDERRRREAASGARAASAEPGPLARGHRAGAAAQDGRAMLLRGTPGASLALLRKLPRPHDPP